MKRITTIAGVVLVAAFALSALAATSASALNLATNSCVRVAAGELGIYKDGSCLTKETNGPFALVELNTAVSLGGGVGCAKLSNGEKNSLWLETGCVGDSPTKVGAWVKYKLNVGGGKKPEFSVLPSVKTFKDDSGLGKLEAGGNKVECQTDSANGEITSMDTVGKVVVTFKTCTIQPPTGTEKCTLKSIGAGEGEIVTKTLKGELGTVKSTETMSEVGLLLEPETTKKFVTFASTKCSIETSVTGNVAGEVTPISEQSTFGEVWFGVTSSKQNIKSITVLSGVKKPELEAFANEATEETQELVLFGGIVEVV